MTTEQHIEKIVEETGIPYLDVSAYRDHKCIFRHFAGKNVTGNELLWMYSCTKPLTVALAMRLVEEGKLSLSAPVSDYLPEYKDVYLMENGVRRAPKTPITVWHLFTMSAGLTYSIQNDAVQSVIRDSGGHASTREVVASFVKNPIVFDPGEGFNYSFCHDVLAAVIEVCAGELYSAYAKRVCFDPMGMESCCFSSAGLKLADQYNQKDGKIELVPTTNCFSLTDRYESGGAGLISNLADYAKLADALACGGVASTGYRLLKEETVKQIYAYESLKFAHPETFGCVQGEGYVYGLGVRVRNTATEWGLLPGEFGWDGAAGSYLMADPNTGISVVMGMHLLGWPSLFRRKHLEIVEDIYKNII